MPRQGARSTRAYNKSGISLVANVRAKPPSFISLAQRKRSRRSRYRDNDNLKPWQVDDLHLADAFATEIELPLNRFITVSWLLTDTGCLDSAVFQRGMKRMCQWLRDKGVTPTWLYVHENPLSDFGDEKPNTHILLHLSRHIRRCDFDAMLFVWFGAVDGGVKSELRTHPGYFGPDRLLYMAKGADFLTCRRYGGYRSKGGQGSVAIKRSGTSQNIATAARSKANAGRRAA